LNNISGPLVTYKFHVTGLNFNGEGPASPQALLRSCTLPSSGSTGFQAPTVNSVSATEISISWIAPENDGGCSLIGYAVYVDNSGGQFSEVDSANIRGLPLLHTYTIDMDALGKTPGSTYLIRMGAENSIGEVFSDSVSVLLASVPNAPSPPLKQVLNSTHARIVMSPPSSDGGDVITSYQL
jgi:hypothetical protein